MPTKCVKAHKSKAHPRPTIASGLLFLGFSVNIAYMKIKTRLIIILICALLFLIFAPYIVFYSFGYRLDFKNMKIRSTGGIYVYAVPEPSSISIDSKTAEKTGLFSSAVFMQNMLPGPHHVLIKKEGYYDYQKTLDVQEKEVTKLEDVVLFKQKNEFTLLDNAIDYFFPSPNGNTLLTATVKKTNINFEITNLTDNQKKVISLNVVNGKITNATWSENATKVLLKISNNYYLLDATGAATKITALPFSALASQINFNPQNSSEFFFIKGKDFYSNVKTLPVIKNMVAYDINGATITWFSYDGFLYQNDLAGNQTTKISTKAFEAKEGAAYEIIIIEGVTFLKENGGLFFLDKDSKTFEVFHDNVKSIINSPDGQKILYFNDHQILISSSEKNHQDKILLDTYADTIHDIQWLNSHYLIISSGDTITISEIDNRGNINKITLPSVISASTDEVGTQVNVGIKNPAIFFHQQTKNLYILSQKNLVVSEKLMP